MISPRLVTLFAHLLEPFDRQIAATELARFVNAESALIFSRQEKTAQFNLAQGLLTSSVPCSAWQVFLSTCAVNSYSAGELTDLDTGEQASFFGMSDVQEQCILVFRGFRPTDEGIVVFQTLLPFLASKLSDEQFILAATENEKFAATQNSNGDVQWHDLRAAYERAEHELAYRREAENKLRVADRRKDEFIATVSHELRTPLNAILGWAELLHLKASSDPSFIKGIDAIIRSAKMQANLINELLDTSSIVAGKIVLHIETLNLLDVLDRARETVEPLALQKNISIHTDFEPLDKVSGDSARLRQVFWNLLCNAIKFTPDGGSIDIVARSNGDIAAIAISDTGMGIEEDFLPYVFDRFRQADASLRRKYGGLGLGLSIAKQFIEMHSGSVTVSSEGINKGSTFFIRLPHAPHPYLAYSSSSKTPTPPDLKAISILAVDDDPDARELISKMLQGYGAHVTTLSSALEALVLLKNAHYDVLLSDISMPLLDGISFIEQVRSFPSSEHGQIPALALSAFSDAKRVKLAHASGFDVVMTKPVMADVLGHAVQELLEKYKQR